MDSLTMSPMFLDGDINVAVVAYKGATLYSLYKDDTIFCRILSILATKQYESYILSEDRRSYYWKKTYTYGPWPPDPKKMILEEPTATRSFPQVSFTPEASIYSIEASPFLIASPSRSSSPMILVEEYLGPYQGSSFDLMRHLYEAHIRENR